MSSWSLNFVLRFVATWLTGGSGGGGGGGGDGGGAGPHRPSSAGAPTLGL